MKYLNFLKISGDKNEVEELIKKLRAKFNEEIVKDKIISGKCNWKKSEDNGIICKYNDGGKIIINITGSPNKDGSYKIGYELDMAETNEYSEFIKSEGPKKIMEKLEEEIKQIAQDYEGIKIERGYSPVYTKLFAAAV